MVVVVSIISGITGARGCNPQEGEETLSTQSQMDFCHVNFIIDQCKLH